MSSALSACLRRYFLAFTMTDFWSTNSLRAFIMASWEFRLIPLQGRPSRFVPDILDDPVKPRWKGGSIKTGVGPTNGAYGRQLAWQSTAQPAAVYRIGNRKSLVSFKWYAALKVHRRPGNVVAQRYSSRRDQAPPCRTICRRRCLDGSRAAVMAKSHRSPFART
jgi:hypothetical protein